MARNGAVPQSTEEGNKNISFTWEKGCFFSTCGIFLLILFFLVAIVATGLLVYFFAAKPHSLSQDQYQTISQTYGKEEIEITEAEEGSVSSQTQPHHHGHHKSNETKKEMETKKKKVKDVRLPRSMKPLHYHVKLIPFINGNFSIHGYFEMTFEVLENTRNVTLHINDVITHNETVKLIDADKMDVVISIQKHMYDIDRQFYVALLNDDLKIGRKYVISMDFTGFLNDKRNGFYRSSYTDESGNERWIAATQFQATHARKAFPCLDEPGLKANFTIELARVKNMTCLSNMPIQESVPMKGHPEWLWDKFETSVSMSTYLVAFIVSDFNYLKSELNSSYDFKVWARESALYQATYALEVGALATKYFEEFFQIPYPLPKQDMIALPEKGYGAMENWGLITYGESAMLFDPKSSKASSKEYVGSTVAHELAHQWFGNIVTPSWWTDLWLNEGFASYMQFLGLDAVEPSFQMLEQFVISKLHPAFYLDSLESSHPISVEVQHPDQINEIFDTISYSKGASIIRMMHLFLEEATFRTGLSNYLKGLEYSIADQDDLWRYLTEQARIDSSLPPELTVKAIMDTWTLQMGFPVISVAKNEDGTIELKQERFLLEKKANSSDKHDYKWWVPITYASKSNPDFKATSPREWMKPSETTKVLSGVPTNEWVIFNVQQAGYYRVNYDHANWNAIIDQLLADHTIISSINRAQILNDALSLSTAGMLPYETSMKILSYLQYEDDYVPWKAALNGVSFISNMFANTGGYGAWKGFLLDLVSPLYNKLGFTDRTTDPHLEQLKRATVLDQVCSLGYRLCVQEAISLYKKWMRRPDNNTIISPNLKHVVYCTAIKHGGFEEWKFAWNKYLENNADTEKPAILTALGCVKESWIQSSYLQKVLELDENNLRTKDVGTVIRSVAYQAHGSALAWEFFKNNYDQIYKNLGSRISSLHGISKTVTYRFNTPNQLKELKEFQKETEGKFGSAKLSVQQTLETAENNLRWMDNHYDTILNWLSENGYENRIV